VRPACRNIPSGGSRRGFVLPLSLFMVMVAAMLVAVLLDGALQELRTARGDLAAARAQAAAGTALTDFFGSLGDSALVAAPRGTVATITTGSGPDTIWVSIQVLGGSLFRVTATARAWAGAIRADASMLGFARVATDSSGHAGARTFRRLPGWWWAQLP
jgi:hypothetical protein